MFWSKEKQEIRRLKDELDRLQARYLSTLQELEWANSELKMLGDRGDSVVYRHEREAFDAWQRNHPKGVSFDPSLVNPSTGRFDP